MKDNGTILSQYSKDVIQAIKVPFSEAPQRLKRELAIRLYDIISALIKICHRKE
jgi:hypothetical protein